MTLTPNTSFEKTGDEGAFFHGNNTVSSQTPFKATGNKENIQALSNKCGSGEKSKSDSISQNLNQHRNHLFKSPNERLSYNDGCGVIGTRTPINSSDNYEEDYSFDGISSSAAIKTTLTNCNSSNNNILKTPAPLNKRLSMHSEPTPLARRSHNATRLEEFASPSNDSLLFMHLDSNNNNNNNGAGNIDFNLGDKPFSTEKHQTSFSVGSTPQGINRNSHSNGASNQQQHQLVTPTIKMVKPDQSAFKSTGFLSKKHRFYHTSNHQAAITNTNSKSSSNSNNNHYYLAGMDASLHHNNSHHQQYGKGTPTPETPSKKATSKVLVSFTPLYALSSSCGGNMNNNSNSNGIVNRMVKGNVMGSHNSKVNTSSPLRKLASFRSSSSSSTSSESENTNNNNNHNNNNSNSKSNETIKSNNVNGEMGGKMISSDNNVSLMNPRITDKTPSRLLFPRASNPSHSHFDSSSPPPFEAQMFPESPPSPLQQRRSSSSLAAPQPSNGIVEDFMMLEEDHHTHDDEDVDLECNSNSSMQNISFHNRSPSSFAEGFSMECIPEQEEEEEVTSKDKHGLLLHLREGNGGMQQRQHQHQLNNNNNITSSSSPVSMFFPHQAELDMLEPSPFLSHNTSHLSCGGPDDIVDDSPFLSSCGNSNNHAVKASLHEPLDNILSIQEEEFEAQLMSSSRSIGSLSSLQGFSGTGSTGTFGNSNKALSSTTTTTTPLVLWRTPFVHHLRPGYFVKMNRDPESENTKMLKLYRQFIASSSSSNVNSNSYVNVNSNINANEDHLIMMNLINEKTNNNLIEDTNHSDDLIEAVCEGYEILCTLGKGSFADVFQVLERSSGNQYAIKKTRSPFIGMKDRLKRLEEVENLWSCAGHSNIVEIKDSWEHHGHLYIVTELCSNGSLESWIIDQMSMEENWCLPEEGLWSILEQIAEGLMHIHGKNIIHLDLKPANILISMEGTLKIGDFGLSTRLENVLEVDCEGDKFYMAPEVLDGSFDKAADIFSLGLIVLELAANIELPAQGEQWHLLRCGDVCSSIPFESERSDSLKMLIDSMLHKNPQERCSTSDILAACKSFRSSIGH